MQYLVGRLKPDTKNEKIQLSYQAGCICFYLTIQYPVLFYLLGLPIASLTSIPFAVWFFLSIYLNHKRHFEAAKYMLILCAFCCLIYFSALLGKWAGAHLILFGAMVLPVIIFEIEKKFTILLLTLMPPAGFVLLELTRYQFLPFTEYISPEIQAKTYLSGGITGFAFVLFQVIIYRNTNHDFQQHLQVTNKEILQKNILLEHTLSKVKQQKAELEAAHIQLKDKEMMEKEIEVAKQIQKPLLPSKLPLYPGYDFHVYYEPCRTIGGDYYDFLPKGKSIIKGVIADMTGKGIPASLMTTHFRSLIHQYFADYDDLELFLSHLNNRVIESEFIQKAVAMGAYILDTATHELTLGVSSMDPFFLIRNGKIQLLDIAGGMPLGMFEDAEYDLQSIHLEPGDHVMMFTDGMFDQKSDKKNDAVANTFGYDNFRDLVKKTFNKGLTTQDAINEIVATVESFAGKEKQADDMTLLVISRS